MTMRQYIWWDRLIYYIIMGMTMVVVFGLVVTFTNTPIWLGVIVWLAGTCVLGEISYRIIRRGIK